MEKIKSRIQSTPSREHNHREEVASKNSEKNRVEVNAKNRVEVSAKNKVEICSSGNSGNKKYMSVLDILKSKSSSKSKSTSLKERMTITPITPCANDKRATHSPPDKPSHQHGEMQLLDLLNDTDSDVDVDVRTGENVDVCTGENVDVRVGEDLDICTGEDDGDDSWQHITSMMTHR